MKGVRRFAFGATAAVMTSMALIAGLGSANSTRTSIVTGLLILGIADNLSDTLGIHIHEESGSQNPRVFGLSISNYFTRLAVVCSFIVLVLLLSADVARIAAVVWGVILLSVLTYFIARAREVHPVPEIAKHLAVAAGIIVLSQLIGIAIRRM